MQAGFDAWRTGEAFKEAHGGGGMSDFFKLLGTALFILDGAPKPAFYAGDLPLTVISAHTLLIVKLTVEPDCPLLAVTLLSLVLLTLHYSPCFDL
jgi:hypothetical protein